MEGKEVKFKRLAMGLTQKELAPMIGMSKFHLSKIESGMSKISEDYETRLLNLIAEKENGGTNANKGKL